MTVPTLLDLPKAVLSYLLGSWLRFEDLSNLLLVNKMVSAASKLAMISATELLVTQNRSFLPEKLYVNVHKCGEAAEIIDIAGTLKESQQINGLLSENHMLLGNLERYCGASLCRLFLKNCPRIVVTRVFLANLSVTCPNLTHLALYECSVPQRSSGLTQDVSLPSLSQCFQSLTSLDATTLWPCPLMLEELLTGSLRERLSELHLFVPEDLQGIELFFRWVKGMSCLDRLKVEKPPRTNPSLPREQVQALLESSVVQGLKCFKLYGFNRCIVGNVGWNDMSQLEELVIDGPTIDATFVDCLVTAPNLQLLDLGHGGTDMGDVAIEKISEACRQLRSIKMGQVSHFGFSRFAENCTMVEEISVGYCKGVGDLTLVTLGSKCANLRYLNAMFCHGISDQGLIGLCETVSTPSRLKTVDLTQCSALTDRALVAISHCPVIENLKIRGMYKVTDNGVLALSLKCRTLRLFDISWCHQVTVLSLEALVKNCLALSYIVMDGCTQIVEQDVIDLSITRRKMLKVKKKPATPPPKVEKKPKKKKKQKLVDFDALLHGDPRPSAPQAKKNKPKKKSKGKAKALSSQEDSPLTKWK